MLKIKRQLFKRWIAISSEYPVDRDLSGGFRTTGVRSSIFKTRPSAKPLLWKWVLFAWEWKTFSYQCLRINCLALKQRLQATRRWPNIGVISSLRMTHIIIRSMIFRIVIRIINILFYSSSVAGIRVQCRPGVARATNNWPYYILLNLERKW